MTITLPPQRRDVLVHRLGDELLVHRPGTEDLHALGATASRVWDLCDGSTTAAAAASRLGLPEEDVRAAVEVLAGLDLLEEPAGLDRRRVLQGALVGAGLVTTMALPTAAMAASDGAVVTPSATPAPTRTPSEQTFTRTISELGVFDEQLPAGAHALEVVLTGAAGAPARTGGAAGGPGARLVLTAPDALVGSGTFRVRLEPGVFPGGDATNGSGQGGAGSRAVLGGVEAVAGGGGGGGAAGSLAEAAGGAGGSGTATTAGAAAGAGQNGQPALLQGSGGTAGGSASPDGQDAQDTGFDLAPDNGGGGGGGGGSAGGTAGAPGQLNLPPATATGIGGGGGGGGGLSLVPAGATIATTTETVAQAVLTYKYLA